MVSNFMLTKSALMGNYFTGSASFLYLLFSLLTVPIAQFIARLVSLAKAIG